MINIKNICKTYETKEGKGLFGKKLRRKVQAVTNVNMKIEKGMIVGLLGLNGAGKTTIIKMISGIIEPSSGSINMDEIDVIKNHMKAKERINLIAGGERNIYWRLTSRENLEYFGSLYGLKRDVLNSRINEIVEIVGLKGSEDIPVEKLSKGMKQRLQIARGLINDPHYIFLDEPTLGLDVLIAKELRGYIKKLANDENKGILLTTHYISEAEELCDYIYVIDKGCIITEGTPQDLKGLFKTDYDFNLIVSKLDPVVNDDLMVLFNNSNAIYTIDDSKLTISIKSKTNIMPDVIKLLVNNHIEIIEMKSNDLNLENILISIIEEGRR